MENSNNSNQQKWRIESVELATEDESNGWFIVYNFEWRVINAQTLEIALRIPYSHVIDNTEYPERDYWRGPQRIEVVGNVVRAYMTVSDRTGVSFEGQQDQPAGYDEFSLPDS